MDRYRETNRDPWNAWTRINLRSEFQCHFGMDTIRWAKHGATVTGVDFSEEAIAAAPALATRMGVPATFVHRDVCDLPATRDGRFDVVFTSHGALCWLPDLERWAQAIARVLAPGGVFYIVEAHPMLQCFDDRLTEPDLRLLYPYFRGREPIPRSTRSSAGGSLPGWSMALTAGGAGRPTSGFPPGRAACR